MGDMLYFTSLTELKHKEHKGRHKGHKGFLTITLCVLSGFFVSFG